MDQFTMAEFAKNSENKEGSSFTPEVQEAGIEQGSLIVSALYNTILGNITKSMRSWSAELVNILSEAGITPSALSSTQLYTAIKKIVEKSHGRNVGDVYFSYSSSAQDNVGGLPLFTGEVISNADNVYPQFWAWLVAHPAVCVSESTWQSTISTYGECAKYVVNTTNRTIRLPLLKNYIKMANTTEGIKNGAAGLPDITGTLPTVTDQNVSNGAFTTSNVTGDFYDRSDSGGLGEWGDANFAASNSNSIYGNSNTVTPAHATLYPWVCAYNEATPASTAQAAEFQAALSGKMDIANLSEVQCIVETYVNGASWYRVWSDGWCEQGGVTPTFSGTDSTVSVSLLKTFANGNYFVVITGPQSYHCSYGLIGSPGTSSFSARREANSGISDASGRWFACGYIA